MCKTCSGGLVNSGCVKLAKSTTEEEEEDEQEKS